MQTSVNCRLQTQEKVRESGLSCPGHAAVRITAVFAQVSLTGLGERVTDLIILSDELLSSGQGVSTLWTEMLIEVTDNQNVSQTQTELIF